MTASLVQQVPYCAAHGHAKPHPGLGWAMLPLANFSMLLMQACKHVEEAGGLYRELCDTMGIYRAFSDLHDWLRDFLGLNKPLR